MAAGQGKKFQSIFCGKFLKKGSLWRRTCKLNAPVKIRPRPCHPEDACMRAKKLERSLMNGE
jgi:hypothetical protein